MGRIRNGRRRRVPRFFGITFRLVLIVAAACLFLSYISSYIDPAKFSLPVFFGLYFIPILIINVLLFLIAVISRSKSAWITIIALLPALLFTERFFRFGGSKKSGDDGNTVKIETYNVGKFLLASNKMTKEATLDGITRQIQKDAPDIVCLQEVRLEHISLVDKVFPGYRYRTFHLPGTKNGKRNGNMILSKYEIISGGVLKFKQSTNLSVYADIVIKEDTVRVYNNHLESYAISPTNLIKRIREKRSNSEEVAEEIINVHTKLKNTIIRRSRQVSSVLDNIRKSPYPAIICGDLNDIPMSYTYHKLSYGSKDTFKESGRGFSATYSMLWPMLRIDYIFIPENYTGISHKTPKYKYSDHYPVIAEFSRGTED